MQWNLATLFASQVMIYQIGALATVSYLAVKI